MTASTVRRTRRANGSKPIPVRSMRVQNSVWDAARRRADYEGITMSNLIAMFLEGYAKGLLKAPRVQLRYEQPTDEPSE